jgi:hypothetical protein
MKTILMAMAVSLLALSAGCDDDTTMAPMADLAQAPAGPPDLGCYGSPQTTSIALLNSCIPAGVTVDVIDKNPTLPLLNPDGTRPPLP